MKKTTWFAVFVVVLVALTYYFEFYQAGKEEVRKGEEAKIVSFNPDQINQVEIQNKSGKILLKRNTDGWSMEQPLKDWADNQVADDFVNALAAEKAIDTIKPEGDVNWASYGLDKDFSQVTFTNQQGQSVSVEVSAKKNFEGNSFLRRGTETQVLVGTSQWLVRSSKTPLDFRDKRFFRGKIGSVDGISIKSPKDWFQLIRKDGKWLNEKQPDVKLDQNKVREVLTSLNEVQALEFLDKVPALKTQAKITLKMTDKAWSGEIKQGADKAVYGVTTEPAFNLKLDPGQLDKFLQMTFMGLRDRKEPFDFQNLSVRHIEIQTKLKKMNLAKDGEIWKLEEDPKTKVDQNAVRQFVMHLSDTGVTEYLDKKEQAGFANPENKIVLKGEGGKLLYELTWGPELTKKAVVGTRQLILAKSGLFHDVFGLDPSVIEAWGLMGLLPVEQTKSKPQKDTP